MVMTTMMPLVGFGLLILKLQSQHQDCHLALADQSSALRTHWNIVICSFTSNPRCQQQQQNPTLKNGILQTNCWPHSNFAHLLYTVYEINRKINNKQTKTQLLEKCVGALYQHSCYSPGFIFYLKVHMHYNAPTYVCVCVRAHTNCVTQPWLFFLLSRVCVCVWVDGRSSYNSAVGYGPVSCGS